MAHREQCIIIWKHRKLFALIYTPFAHSQNTKIVSFTRMPSTSQCSQSSPISPFDHKSNICSMHISMFINGLRHTTAFKMIFNWRNVQLKLVWIEICLEFCETAPNKCVARMNSPFLYPSLNLSFDTFFYVAKIRHETTKSSAECIIQYVQYFANGEFCFAFAQINVKFFKNFLLLTINIEPKNVLHLMANISVAYI